VTNTIATHSNRQRAWSSRWCDADLWEDWEASNDLIVIAGLDEVSGN